MAEPRGPHVVFDYRDTTEIPLFWFTRADETSRQALEAELNALIDQAIEQESSLVKKTITSVPWIRNYDPTFTDLQSWINNFDSGSSAWLLAICDKDYKENRSLRIIHPTKEGSYGCVSTSFENALAVQLKPNKTWNTPLEEAFEGLTYQADEVVHDPTNLSSFDAPGVRGSLPAHLPLDVSLKEDVVTLFALAKLTDGEIKRIRKGMDDENDEAVIIHNWHDEIPASETDIYNIFHHYKPPMIPPCEETFVFFIDVEYIEGPQREPVVLYVKQQTPTGSLDRRPSQYLQLTSGDLGGLEHVKEKWKAIWNPPQGGWVNDVRVNWSFDRPSDRQKSRAEWSYPHTVISPPSIPVFGTLGMCEFVAFVLCPITPLELRALRAMIKVEGGGGQFVQLSLKDDSIETLLEFFDSSTFRKYSEPPPIFCAIDQKSLDSLMACWPKWRDSTWDERISLSVDDNDGKQSAFLLIADKIRFWHRGKTGNLIAMESPGYQFARLDLGDEDSLRDIVANLETGNMWFEELSFLFLDGNEIEIALWPEYEGLSKDFLSSGN